MTVGSPTIQEDYASNIFLLRWPGKRLANTVKRSVAEISPQSQMKTQMDFSKLWHRTIRRFGWVDIAMEKTGCGRMQRPGCTKTGFRVSLTILMKSKLIFPSILTSQAIGTMTFRLKRSHFYVLGKKVSMVYLMFKMSQYLLFICSLPDRVEIIQWLLLQICP